MTARRTQQQRRDETVAKLVDSAVNSLCTRGYSATTVQLIASGAGVSTGGLFRHFPSRLDIMVAAADEVRRRQFEAFRAGLQGWGTGSIEHCLVLLRAACRAPINGAWYELLIASRSDDALRERLMPFTVRYHEQIAKLGRTLDVADTIAPEQLDTVLFTVVYLLDGEALSSAVHSQPQQDEMRLRMVAALLRGGTLFDSARE